MASSTVDLDAISKVAASNPIWAARGLAIQAYANLEQSLLTLFVNLTKMEPAIAGIVYFKNTSSQARIAILDKLIRKRYGSTYSLFWNSYLYQLRPIDIKRNEIVHWNTVNFVSVSPEGAQLSDIRLVPPNIWEFTPEDSPQISVSDLIEFINKCDVYCRLCTVFDLHANHKNGVSASWRGIFYQPIVYPLPADHPLCQSWPAPQSPPPPSPA